MSDSPVDEIILGAATIFAVVLAGLFVVTVVSAGLGPMLGVVGFFVLARYVGKLVMRVSA